MYYDSDRVIDCFLYQDDGIVEVKPDGDIKDEPTEPPSRRLKLKKQRSSATTLRLVRIPYY